MKRNIIEIDERLCTGCGDCVTACAEGAIQLVEGKARVVRDEYCDGLGACVGGCPTGALKVIQRDAPAYDVAATEHHVRSVRGEDGVKRMHASAAQHAPTPPPAAPSRLALVSAPEPAGGGCPGSRARMPAADARPAPAVTGQGLPAKVNAADLQQWPVQLHLVPERAPFFAGRELVVMATCVPVASADAHWRFLRGRSVVVACPKLDVTAPYVDKLTAIMAQNDIPRVLVTRMTVPCCSGLSRMVAQAAQRAGRPELVVEEVILALDGSVQSQQVLAQ